MLRRMADTFFPKQAPVVPCPQPSEWPIYQKPSIPESFPITNLQDLKSKAYKRSYHYEFIRSTVPLPITAIDLPKQRRILVCHDMQNGYLDDRFVQGENDANAYAFWHWQMIDVFVYFSHNLVTVPPVRWVNQGHGHGVKVLGTFIMEGNFCSKPTCEELLSSEKNAQNYAKILAEVANDLGFDGWLINVEIRFMHLVNTLKIFVSHLTEEMHSLVKGSLVIWYDAVTEQGLGVSQNQLNAFNKCFFDICDGIYTNYGWKKDYPKKSAEIAGDRRFDVFMGIDVFGRHDTYAGGKWKTNVALNVVKEADVSAAIFAPGWVYETNQPPDFHTAQNKWWNLVGEAWEVDKLHPKPLHVPLYLNFDQGHNRHIYVDGQRQSSASGNFQFKEDGGDHSSIHVLENLKGESYGGGVITFMGNLEDSATFTTRLFGGKLHLTEPLHLTYSVKLGGNSQLGLYILMEDGTSVLVAPVGKDRFSGGYDVVIKPDVFKEEEWVIQECVIDKKGTVLKEIHALCYKDANSDPGPDTYNAVLGHVALRASKLNSELPPSGSWDVHFDNLELHDCSQDNKMNSLNVKLSWRLTSSSASGSDSQSLHYNIYVATRTDEMAGGGAEEITHYLGVARANAFYISKFRIPSITTSLKFIIQVCGIDGTCLPLNDSPSCTVESSLLKAYCLPSEGSVELGGAAGAITLRQKVRDPPPAGAIFQWKKNKIIGRGKHFLRQFKQRVFHFWGPG